MASTWTGSTPGEYSWYLSAEYTTEYCWNLSLLSTTEYSWYLSIY